MKKDEVIINGRTFVFGERGAAIIAERGRILRGVKEVYRIMREEYLPINEISRKSIEGALKDKMTPRQIVAAFRREF